MNACLPLGVVAASGHSDEERLQSKMSRSLEVGLARALRREAHLQRNPMKGDLRAGFVVRGADFAHRGLTSTSAAQRRVRLHVTFLPWVYRRVSPVCPHTDVIRTRIHGTTLAVLRMHSNELMVIRQGRASCSPRRMPPSHATTPHGLAVERIAAGNEQHQITKPRPSSEMSSLRSLVVRSMQCVALQRHWSKSRAIDQCPPVPHQLPFGSCSHLRCQYG